MRIDKLVLLIAAILLVALWRLALRFGWAERNYEQTRKSSFAWFWLDTFHVPKTRENCVRFIRWTWTAGVLLMAIGTVVVLIWGR